MRNDYFQFKQFRIAQDKCAMKVTTDACIFGAWVPLMAGVKRVLDIGTGTGLLALMLAQKNSNLLIDAIELDTDTASQAKENVEDSNWYNRITVVQRDARGYSGVEKYDLVITNPPFFNNSLLSDIGIKNNARHTLSLGYTDLLQIIADNLSADGYAAILLPMAESKLWKALAAENGWHIFQELNISHRAKSAIKRVVMLMRQEEKICTSETLVIQNENENYTIDFINLLQPFYLNL